MSSKKTAKPCPQPRDAEAVAEPEMTSTSNDGGADMATDTGREESLFPTTASGGLSSHIVGPDVAPDVQMLEQYLSQQKKDAVSHVHPNPYSIYSDDPRDPVVYLKVPKQRSAASSGNGTPGFKQWEVMENILYPLGPRVLELYFDVFHPAFPLLDEMAVKKAYQEGSLPYTLACEIYAVSMVSWHLSPYLVANGRNQPDLRYMWNTAVSAMHVDFQTPSISTVLACILDLLGRPITSITYNAINIGSAVALAQSLGLNRNPTNWKLDPRQKNLRVKTWWALLIHDTWASLCHGTPGHIHRDQWDVDLPQLSTVLDPLADSSNGSRTNGAHTFIALCQLTKLLGGVLSVVYTLRPDPLEQNLKVLRRTDTYVDELQDAMPTWLNPDEPSFEREQPGALNLQLSFLAVKMCICRAALQATRVAGDSESLYYQARCIKVGNMFIDAVVSLSAEEVLRVFWLPYVAYHFASAATLMMRCALEAENEDVAVACIRSARKLIDYLERTKSQTNWDLADICLNQCETTVKHMSDNNNLIVLRRIKADSNSNNTQHLETATDGAPRTSDFAGEVDAADPGTDNMPEHEDLFSDIQEHMMEEFYFPDLWQVPHP